MRTTTNLDRADEQIRDVYAYYGLAMYHAQCLERELAIFMACVYGPQHSHRWAFEARLGENFGLTFGQLAKRFLEVAISDHADLANRVQAVVDLRNQIAHHYFWNRVTEFGRPDGRQGMLDELLAAGAEFQTLDGELTTLTTGWSAARGISEVDRQAALSELLTGEATPYDVSTTLPKQVQLSGVYRWHGDPERPTRFGPLLRTSDGLNLLFANRGLCLGPPIVSDAELELIAEMNKALPATVNPFPKKATDWNYTISLGNDFELWVEPHEEHDYRWGVRSKRRVSGSMRAEG